MNVLERAKQRYNEIPIPDELSGRIQLEVRLAKERQAEDEKREKVKLPKRPIPFRRLQKSAAAAAAVLLIFAGALNTNMVFAKSAEELPVIGVLARVLTFRSYEEKTDDLEISVEIPSIDMIAEDLKGAEQPVNEEILRLCEQYAAEAEKRAIEYRDAFFATGGTEEEWKAHNIQIRVWYEVKAQSDKYLSLAVMGTENWTNAYSRTKYYNIDLQSGSLVSLSDILGENYKQKADQEISRQIRERQKAGGVYFDGFEGISEDTQFYLNESGEPVIVFEPYEIAPGSEGRQEFVISE